MLLFLALLIGLGLAQRPSNATSCDYYAEQLYGTNSSKTQYELVKHVVALAFAGPPPKSTNISSDITGILHPGVFQDEHVNLMPWFNGKIGSTNLNNQAVGVDWLDGGGLDPLYAYINGSASDVVLPNTTNQYRLFDHFFHAFSHLVFQCSDPPASSAPHTVKGPSLAYAHKYMNLNYTDLGHFIDQLSLASQNYGFSKTDAQTFVTNLNDKYNVRCAAPVGDPPQLESLCQASSCPLPLDASSADCAAYVNLTENGLSPAASSAEKSNPTETPTPFVPSTVSSTTATSPTSSPAPTQAASPSSLSAGAIAGIAIGGAAVLLGFAVALIWLFLRHRKHQSQAQAQAMHQHPGHSSYATTFTGPPPEQELKVTSWMGASHPTSWGSPPPAFPGSVSPEPQVAEMDTTHAGRGNQRGSGHWGNLNVFRSSSRRE